MRRITRFTPHAVVFLSSMAVMIVELAASRLVSKYLGNSLYTWTSVIGIVLGGISLGNWAGGKIADRFPPRKAIPVVLLASSFLTVLIVALDLLVGRITSILDTQGMSVSILVRSIALITVLFFLPSCAMGTVSPLMAKYALDGAGGIGKTVGGLYAAGALGSIAGTFLSGYLLIPLLGLAANILLVGMVLAALSLAMGGWRLLSAAWLLILAVLAATDAAGALARRIAELSASPTRLVYMKDSPYSFIQVTDKARGWGDGEGPPPRRAHPQPLRREETRRASL